MKIHLLFFAQARERAGHARATLELPEGSRVADALAEVQRLHPGLAELMPHLAVAVNQKLARPGDTLPGGAELALLPPVSGGRGAPKRAGRAAEQLVPREKANAKTKAKPKPKPKPKPHKTPAGSLSVRPATPERWRDVERLFGPRGACAGCWCQWPRLRGREFKAGRGAGNRRRLRRLVSDGAPPGLIGYLGDDPVAWCAVAPRAEYARLENSRILARVDSQVVWSVPCFFVARGARGRGLTVRMLRAAAAHARARGASVLEGYPIEPHGRAADTFAWWGLVGAFRKAGFTEVARRSKTHPVMRKRLRGRGALVGAEAAAAESPASPTAGPSRSPRTRARPRG
jgi:molybdopterin converting factor subunit 1